MRKRKINLHDINMDMKWPQLSQLFYVHLSNNILFVPENFHLHLSLFDGNMFVNSIIYLFEKAENSSS